MDIAQVRKDADFAEELGYGDHARKLRDCADAYDGLLTTWAECRELLSVERKANEDFRAALTAYFRHLRKSVNVGPLTSNPTKEAALLRRLMELLEKPSPDVKNIHQPDATPAGAVVAEGSGVTAGETVPCGVADHTGWSCCGHPEKCTRYYRG